MSMLRMKSVFMIVTLAVIANLVPVANAATIKLVIAGSSAMWQTAALGAYNGGSCPLDGVAPCFHWTSGSNKLSLQDSRPTFVGGFDYEDAGTVWVVWDSSTVADGPNVWVYTKVDSVVGDRCFFANPACQMIDILNPATNLDWRAAGSNQIQDPCSTVAGNLWGDNSCDTTLPNSVLAIVTVPANVPVNVAATDIRPEDAWWAIARVNSIIGKNSYDMPQSDGLDGLGYNSANPSGVPPSLGTVTCTKATLAQGAGTPIYSAYEQIGASTDAANVLAFNESGYDPFSCNKLSIYDFVDVGAAPIVFVSGRQNNLGPTVKGGPLINATDSQLQQAFSGLNADASAFGLPAASIDVYLREPISGTMNTVEADVFRYPTLYSSNPALAQNVQGYSQETGVNPALANNNPLQLASAGTGLGFRYRAIGTGEEIHSVQYSTNGNNGVFNNANQVDGIGYAFFSYGNVSPLADSVNYGYIMLDGFDPIFTSYVAPIDPGQPNPTKYGGLNGVLPGTIETTFPTCENKIWYEGLSFPNLRNGSYRAWSVLRFVYATIESTAVTDLVKASNTYVVTSVPDYIPFSKVTIPAKGACGTAAFTDPGVAWIRSHYQQRDGADDALGKAPVNCGATEAGGDMGGYVLPNLPKCAVNTQDVENPFFGPVLRPNQ
jgi:hypothetical protein